MRSVSYSGIIPLFRYLPAIPETRRLKLSTFLWLGGLHTSKHPFQTFQKHCKKEFYACKEEILTLCLVYCYVTNLIQKGIKNEKMFILDFILDDIFTRLKC